MEPDQKEPVRGNGAGFRDRTAGLVIFGVFEILIGGFCALLVPLGFVAARLSSGLPGGGGTGLGSIVPMLAVYAVFSVILIWIGIGSIRARRWACDLMLSISRIWLLTGVCMVLLTWIVLPGFVRALGADAGVPPEAVVVATAATLAIVSLIYVLLPGAFVLFYRSPHVIATCRFRDPRPQFTDDCPPRILTLATVWGMAAISVLVMPAYNWVFPFFGKLLKGAAGALPWAAVAVACGVLAWGSCRRRLWAWWGGVAATIAAGCSTLLTSARVSLDELFRALLLPEEQMNALASLPWPGGWSTSLFWIVVWGSVLAYLVTVRKLFDRSRPSDDG